MNDFVISLFLNKFLATAADTIVVTDVACYFCMGFCELLVAEKGLVAIGIAIEIILMLLILLHFSSLIFQLMKISWLLFLLLLFLLYELTII